MQCSSNRSKMAMNRGYLLCGGLLQQPKQCTSLSVQTHNNKSKFLREASRKNFFASVHDRQEFSPQFLRMVLIFPAQHRWLRALVPSYSYIISEPSSRGLFLRALVPSYFYIISESSSRGLSSRVYATHYAVFVLCFRLTAGAILLYDVMLPKL